MPSLKQKQYFEEGQTAALCGKTLEQCPYKKIERKSAWRRGWHEGALIKGIQGNKPIESQATSTRIAALRNILHSTGAHA